MKGKHRVPSWENGSGVCAVGVRVTDEAFHEEAGFPRDQKAEESVWGRQVCRGRMSQGGQFRPGRVNHGGGREGDSDRWTLGVFRT